MSEKNPIVCDNGTGFVKVGFAKDNFPQHIFPSMIGRPLMRFEEEFSDGVELKDVMVGDECSQHRSMLDVSYPLVNGQVKDWDGMKHLWDYTFHERLQVDTTEHKILLTEPPMNPLNNRVQMCQFMFETYDFPAVQVSLQARLVLYAQGLFNGVVLDAGDGVSHVVPVYDGVTPVEPARLNVAGRHMTQNLIKLLQVRGYSFNRSADMATVQLLKEKYCYIGYDLEIEKKLALETTVLLCEHKLPDGLVVKMDRERYEAPEILFNPALTGECEDPGIHRMLFDLIQKKAAMDIRTTLWKHVVLSGGSTMYPGLPSRLEKELRSCYLTDVAGGDEKRLAKFKLKIEDPPRRKHMVFLGGSFLADAMRTRAAFWISKAEWEEHGARILEQK